MRSRFEVLLMSYSAAASPARPLVVAPERLAAAETTSRIFGVASSAAVDCWGPTRRVASSGTVVP